MNTTTCTVTFGEDGVLVINGAQTLQKYQQIRYGKDAPMEGCFFAFDKQQFEEGYEQIKHLLGENEKIVSVGHGTGMFGVRKYVDRVFDFYDNKNKLIREECDPQEVYYYEWNNYETCYTIDDEKAIKIIIDIWGVEVAKTIKRICDAQTIDQILMYDLERKIKLYYINDGKPTVPRTVWLNEQGLAYTMVECRLFPVYQACGKQYKMGKKFANVTAYYDGKKLYHFHIE